MNDLNTANVLLIGGSVFVGKAIATHLVQNGCSVTLLNRGNTLIQNTRQLIADRNNIEKMRSAALEGANHYDAVIDTSAFTGEQTRIAWSVFHEKTERWIHLGSASVYKNGDGRPPKEGEEIGGAGVWGDYGRDKSASDTFLLDQRGGPSITIFRPPYIYGPGNNHDRETFIWSRVLRGRPVLIPSDGQTRIQFVHTLDLAEAIACVLRQAPASEPHIYNIGEEERPTLQEYVSKLAAVAQSKDTGLCIGKEDIDFSPRQYFPYRDYPCVVEAEKIKSELGWKPQFNFLTGFLQTFESYETDYLKNRPIETEVEDKILAKMFPQSANNVKE